MPFRNIRDLLETRASDFPDKPFLFAEADGRKWLFAEFDRAVNRSSNMLLSHGIHRGDVVSLFLPNSPEYIAAYFACWKIGAIAGPINSLLKPEEVEWVVQNSESKIILVNSSFIPEINETPQTIAGIPTLRFDDLEEATSEFSAELPTFDIENDDEAIIIHTSGTTGKPKGCLLTHGNLLANARQITEWLGFNPDDRLLTVMPLFHMNAVTVTTMSALYCGGSTVVCPKFSASRFWDIIDKYQITSFGSVATMLSLLLTNVERSTTKEQRSTKKLRFAMCGSAPVPSEVLNRFEQTFGVLVIEGYGLSESTCRSTFNPPNEAHRPGSCGLPIGNEVKVFDENDLEVPDGELGEIVLRGPNIFKGYFKNPEATEKAFANGWFHTGDIGYRDPDGFLYIADRKSDMIIRGGENIYPREIDDLLYTHPAVSAAAVIGVPDELYGEEVAAFIVLKDGFAIEDGDRAAEDTKVIKADDITNFCKLHLADFKCPKTVHFVPDIPKGPTGKLLKRELAKLYSEVKLPGKP